MAKTRQRKKADSPQEDTKPPKLTQELKEDTEVGDSVALLVFVAIVLLALSMATYFYYKHDQENNGPFAAWVQNNLLPKNRYQR